MRGAEAWNDVGQAESHWTLVSHRAEDVLFAHGSGLVSTLIKDKKVHYVYNFLCLVGPSFSAFRWCPGFDHGPRQRIEQRLLTEGDHQVDGAGQFVVHRRWRLGGDIDTHLAENLCGQVVDRGARS